MATNQKRSLKAFMRESAKVEEIIQAPGPESIKDEDGKPIMLEIKKLSNATVQGINEKYRTRKIAADKNGNPYIINGEVAFEVDRDNTKASRHIMVEALVHPNLKDPELMKFFECVDVTEMPMKVFPTADEYSCVSKAVMAALGLSGEPTKEDTDKALSEAKN